MIGSDCQAMPLFDADRLTMCRHQTEPGGVVELLARGDCHRHASKRLGSTIVPGRCISRLQPRSSILTRSESHHDCPERNERDILLLARWDRAFGVQNRRSPVRTTQTLREDQIVDSSAFTLDGTKTRRNKTGLHCHRLVSHPGGRSRPPPGLSGPFQRKRSVVRYADARTPLSTI